MNEKTLQDMREHASREYPGECCGVIIVVRGKERYVPCRNMADTKEHFIIHPEDYAAAEDLGEVTAIVHSHCNLPPFPSQPDLIGCESSGKPWVIVSWPTGVVHTFEPSGYKAPLIGREFHHGVLDCYALCRDYYKEVLGIELADYPREYEWWLKGQNLYIDHFEEVGFVRVDPETLRPHDGILMQLASPAPNHAGIYIGDNLILQHVMHRLSSRDVYGGWYRKCSVGVFRHRSLL